MFKKNSNGNFVSSKTSETNGEQFEKDTKFEMDGDLYVVMEAFESDNTPMRRIRNRSTSVDEIITLVELKKDARLSKSFNVIDADEAKPKDTDE